MLGIYLFQRFLNKMDDYKFEKYWEIKILRKQRMYWGLAAIYYFVALGIINQILLYGNQSLFLGLLVIVFTAVIYGGYFMRSLLRFIGLNNGRYMQIKTGMYQDNNTSGFSKDNVVG
ncbi:hypothetical protein KQ51_01235 [Candidatus Izimaplasma bacterium HR1]|jgi:hypothetical protein|uniref:hypothetical protein n=1 Tax=Candidatus Izimoplasma sp. HR1 TaxID=1541959 RepID=UPI0004F810A0|nr:hypothetical protein KQ51_01235 [Candidatus Izimaplasma bacterium HR1]